MSDKANIKRVIYSEPATIVFWDDGTKTISKCDEQDEYDELTGFLMCVLKKKVPHKQWRKALKKYVYGNDPKYVKRDVVKDEWHRLLKDYGIINNDNKSLSIDPTLHAKNTYTNNEPITITMGDEEGKEFARAFFTAILGV